MRRLFVLAALLPALAFGQGVAKKPVSSAVAPLVISGGSISCPTCSAGAQPYDVAVYYPGKPGNSAIMGRVVLTRAVTFPAALSGSKCSIGTNATAEAVVAVAVSGSVSCSGTVTVATNGTCTYAMTDPCVTAAGDLLTVTAPASADATMADVSITVAGSR